MPKQGTITTVSWGIVGVTFKQSFDWRFFIFIVQSLKKWYKNRNEILKEKKFDDLDIALLKNLR